MTESEIRNEIAEDGNVHNNPMSTRNVDGETSKPKLMSTITTSNVNLPRTERKLERKSAPTKETVHLDIGIPFVRNKLIDQTLPRPSNYVPSSHMMYYILNKMDSLMCQNHHFLQNNIYYHPLISRVYYGILFHIQTLRCMNHVKVLDRNSSDFLMKFLDAYPPESLSIAGPLATLFQSIAVSKSRFAHSGKIHPIIPNTEEMFKIKPKDKFPLSYSNYNFLLPNMYLLYGSIQSLTSDRVQGLVGTSNFPKVWNPFAAMANTANDNATSGVPFNGLSLSTDVTTWAISDRWLLVSPGMSYRLESTKDLDERFSKNGAKIGIPRYSESEQTLDVEDFLNLKSLEWFGEVMSIMTSYAKYFKLATTLDKCSVEGPMTAQIVCKYCKTATPLAIPRHPGDIKSVFPLYFEAKSANPEITDTDQIMAFASQLNIVFPSNHTYTALKTWDTQVDPDYMIREGDYWTVRPIMMRSGIDRGFLQVKDVVQDHFYLDKPKF